MPPGPSPLILEDPRFEQVFGAALRKHGLPDYLADPVRKLVSGEADPRSYQCCGSGCTPCMKDYLGAAEMVLRTLSEPAGGSGGWLRRLFTRRRDRA